MMKWILALALVGTLAVGYASATSSSNVGATSVNGALVQVGPAVTVALPAAHAPAQEAPAAVEGHATNLGSSTPQSPGQRASSEPTAPGAPLGHRPPCPTGHHLGIMCTAP
jgi:hypothetical protein